VGYKDSAFGLSLLMARIASSDEVVEGKNSVGYLPLIDETHQGLVYMNNVRSDSLNFPPLWKIICLAPWSVSS
jgi:hypothetical protein